MESRLPHTGRMKQNPRVAQYFLCYRRDDTAGHAGRLHADLVRAFGEEAVFFDLPSVPVGEDYRDVVRHSVAASTVVLVVIGRQWQPELLHDQDDDVRIEIEAALDGNKRIVPVLVQGTPMPKAEQLPETIRPFAQRNAAELTDRHWKSDVKALIRTVRPPARPRRWLGCDRCGGAVRRAGFGGADDDSQDSAFPERAGP